LLSPTTASLAQARGKLSRGRHFCSGFPDPGIALVDIPMKAHQHSPAYDQPDLHRIGSPGGARCGALIRCICGRDDQQGETLLLYLLKNRKEQKIAFVHDKDALPGKGLADATNGVSLSRAAGTASHVRRP